MVPDRGLTALARLADRWGRRRLAAELRVAAVGKAWNGLDPHPGYTGEPALASAAAGEHFVASMVERYVERIPPVLEGRAPHPTVPLAWLARLSLGGRVEL